MGLELAKAYVTVRGDASQVAGDFRGQAAGIQSSVTGMAGSIARVMAGLGIALGLREIVGLFNEAVQGAMESDLAAERMGISFEIAGDRIGFSRDQLEGWIDEVHRASWASDESLTGASAKLLMFDSIRGETFHRALQDSQDLAVLMGGSATAAARMLGRAIEDPSRGMMMLRRAGIMYTKQQQEDIKTLMREGETYRARMAVLSGMEAKTIDPKTGKHISEMVTEKPAGHIKQMRRDLAELKEAMGRLWYPVTEGMLEFKMAYVELMTTLAGWVGGAVKLYRDWAKQHGELAKWIKAIVASAIVATGVYLAWIGLVKAWTTAMKVAAVVKTYLAGLSGPVGWGVIAGATLAATAAAVTFGVVLNDVGKAAGKQAVATIQAENAARDAAEAAAARKEEEKTETDNARKKLEGMRQDYEDLATGATKAQIAYRKFAEEVKNPKMQAEGKGLIDAKAALDFSKRTLGPIEDEIEAITNKWDDATKASMKFIREGGHSLSEMVQHSIAQRALQTIKMDEGFQETIASIKDIAAGLSDAEQAAAKFNREAHTMGEKAMNARLTYAKEIVDYKRSMMTPYEQYVEEMERIQRMQERGMDPETARRGRYKETEKLWGGGHTAGFGELGKKIQEMYLNQAVGGDIPSQQLEMTKAGVEVQRRMLVVLENPRGVLR